MALPTLFANWHKLSTRIVGLLLSFLAVALLVIGSTLLLSWQLEGSAAAINVAGSLRMDSYRMAMLAGQVDDVGADPRTREHLLYQLQGMEEKLQLLQRGDPQRPLFLPPTASIRDMFGGVLQQWRTELAPQAHDWLGQSSATPASVRALQQRSERFVARVDELVQRIERDSENRTFWLRASQLTLLGLALVGTVSIIYLLFDMIVAPVTRLQGGLERMREKDFGVRLPVDRNDEFGMLASGFNQMADRLQSVYGNLEQMVSVKTQALEQQNHELALLYDSAAFLQQPQPAEAMCRGFLQRISDYFGADGGTVRILDPIQGNMHMLVSQGISERLVETERCLKVGDCLCGDAVVKKVAVIHDLRKLDRGHQLECHKEGFATVSIFHVYAQQQHLGFFNALPPGDRVQPAQTALLETLGQLLGTAIENQRLEGRSRQLAVSEERNLVAQGLHDSIAQGLNFLNLQVQMLEQSCSSAVGRSGEHRAGAARGRGRELSGCARTAAQLPHPSAGGNLLSSLEAVVDKFRRQSGITVDIVAETQGRLSQRAAAAIAVHRAGSAVECAQACGCQPGLGRWMIATILCSHPRQRPRLRTGCARYAGRLPRRHTHHARAGSASLPTSACVRGGAGHGGDLHLARAQRRAA
jgi:two-component system nitrate/nitrite sensor histidine kinase NarX